MEENANEITGKEIERFIELQAAEGKSPLETISALLEIVGAESIPEFKKG